MEKKITKLEQSKIEVLVSVDKEMWAKAQKDAFNKLAANVESKGFRKGKAPADMVKVVGDNQTGIAGSTIVTAPGVRVVDAFGNPLGNIPVTFTPGPNSGTGTAGAALTEHNAIN